MATAARRPARSTRPAHPATMGTPARGPTPAPAVPRPAAGRRSTATTATSAPRTRATPRSAASTSTTRSAAATPTPVPWVTPARPGRASAGLPPTATTATRAPSTGAARSPAAHIRPSAATMATSAPSTPAAVGTACDDGNPATKLAACTVNAQCIGARLLAPLPRTAGEDPSVSATIRAAGDGRWNGTTARVRLANLDPRRYPANARCRVDVTAGSVVGAGTISNGVAPGTAVAVTNMDFLQNGAVRSGHTATVRIRCIVGGPTHDP